MGRLATVYLLRPMQPPFLGYTSAQISAVAYAQGAVHVVATEKEVRAWTSASEYVWLRDNGLAGIHELRGNIPSLNARRCCNNFVEQLGFRLGT